MAQDDDTHKYTLELLKGLADRPQLYVYCKQVDLLNDAKEFDQCFDLLASPPLELKDHVEILWRTARSDYDRAQQKPSDRHWQEKWIKAGMPWAERALATDPSNWAAHKWYAILISQLGAFISKKKQIFNAFAIKEHALRALELKPGDPVLLHVLGRWCYEVAGISWVQSKLAIALDIAIPQSTYQSAYDYFKQADARHHWIANLYYLALSSHAMDDTALEHTYYRAVLDLPCLSPMDAHYQGLATSKFNHTEQYPFQYRLALSE